MKTDEELNPEAVKAALVTLVDAYRQLAVLPLEGMRDTLTHALDTACFFQPSMWQEKHGAWAHNRVIVEAAIRFRNTFREEIQRDRGCAPMHANIGRDDRCPVCLSPGTAPTVEELAPVNPPSDDEIVPVQERKHLDDMGPQEVVQELEAFARRHGVEFSAQGTVGIGRPCVGLLKDGRYVEYRPRRLVDARLVDGFSQDSRLDAPDGVEAYHKHDCLAVLGEGEAVCRQLLAWVRHLEGQGRVEIVPYDTGATGVQAMLTGRIGYAIRFKEEQA